jgi:hypothetical protein
MITIINRDRKRGHRDRQQADALQYRVEPLSDVARCGRVDAVPQLHRGEDDQRQRAGDEQDRDRQVAGGENFANYPHSVSR